MNWDIANVALSAINLPPTVCDEASARAAARAAYAAHYDGAVGALHVRSAIWRLLDGLPEAAIRRAAVAHAVAGGCCNGEISEKADKIRSRIVNMFQ